MKKLLLPLLFLPSLLMSQDLPTVYATVDGGPVPFNPFQRDPAFDILDEGDKFIERGKILEC